MRGRKDRRAGREGKRDAGYISMSPLYQYWGGRRGDEQRGARCPIELWRSQSERGPGRAAYSSRCQLMVPGASGRIRRAKQRTAAAADPHPALYMWLWTYSRLTVAPSAVAGGILAGSPSGAPACSRSAVSARPGIELGVRYRCQPQLNEAKSDIIKRCMNNLISNILNERVG